MKQMTKLEKYNKNLERGMQVKRNGISRLGKALVAFGAVVVTLFGVPVGVASANDNFNPLIIGGHAASEPYPGMVSLQVDFLGEEDFHFCGATLVTGYWAVTNAHCVTEFDGSPVDPGLIHARVGSHNRLAGGKVVGVEKILPHPDWDWATGNDRVADIALLRLDTYVQLQPFEIAPRPADRSAITRLLGWGVTEPSGEDPLPLGLQELDTRVVQPAQCVDGFIGEGELCVRNPNGTDGPCYGDSGGPALQKVGSNRWSVVGGTSRGTSYWCGTGPAVYTDVTYYRPWMYETIRTGSTLAPKVSNRNAVPHRYWISGRG